MHCTWLTRDMMCMTGQVMVTEYIDCEMTLVGCQQLGL